MQDWLDKANTMTRDEIIQLAVKPDIKKAMLYVVEQQHSNTQNGLAEQLADLMMAAHAPRDHKLEIHRYMGMGTNLVLPSGHRIDVPTGICFGKLADKLFVSNNWCNLNANMEFMDDSVFLETGTPTRLNQLNQLRHAKSQLGDTEQKLITGGFSIRIQR